LKTVDARGLACPQPVINTKNALAEAEQVVVIVDNETARENVKRMAQSKGFDVSLDEQNDGIYLYISHGDERPVKVASVVSDATPIAGPTVLLIASNTFGQGPEELGDILIRGFLHTLGEVESRPDIVILLNSGAQLAIEGSPVVEDLQMLARQGCEILVCGTCLGYFDLKDKVAVGTVSNMYDIAEALLGAGRVVPV